GIGESRRPVVLMTTPSILVRKPDSSPNKEHFRMSPYEAREAIARRLYEMECRSEHISTNKMRNIWETERECFWDGFVHASNKSKGSQWIRCDIQDTAIEKINVKIVTIANEFNCIEYHHENGYIELFSES